MNATELISPSSPSTLPPPPPTINNNEPPAPTSPPKTPILSPLPPSSTPKPHHLDNEPLLISRVPNVPSDTELIALLTTPALTYLEARGKFTEEDAQKPVRCFCSVCGYWGRVKCLKCGGRVCALECLREHQVECYTRYGA